MLMKKNKWKKEDNKRKKDKHDNLGDNEKRTVKKIRERRKESYAWYNLDDIEKAKMKKEDNKKKKA